MKNKDDLMALEIVLDEILRAEGAGSAFMLGFYFSKKFEFSDEGLRDKHVRAMRALLKHTDHSNEAHSDFCYRLLHGLTEGIAVLPVMMAKPE